MGPRFQFLKKVFPTIFLLTKHVSQHFTLIEAQKSTKIFSNQFFKILYKLLSPYGTKISIFEKSVSDNFLLTKHVSQHFTLIEAHKSTKIFSNQFFKIFYKLLFPRGPKFQFLKKVFPTIFLLTKHVSQHFTLIEAKKSTNIFSNQFFKIFYKLLSPYGTKISIFEKSVSDNFFTYKTCFTTFHVD